MEINALAEPTRMRMLESLVGGSCRIKELSRAMRIKPQNLYHHLKILLASGLVVETGSRMVGNLRETSYAARARTFAFSPELDVLHSAEGREARVKMLSAIVRVAADEMERELPLTEGIPTAIAKRVIVGIDPSKAAAFGERLSALIEEFSAAGGDAGDGDVKGEDRAWAMTVVMHEMGPGMSADEKGRGAEARQV